MTFLKEKQMKISDWLDEREAASVDVSQVELPAAMTYDEVPDEAVFFEEDNPCGLLCNENHPFARVIRFGHWYCCKGQDKKAGIHTADMKWRLNTRDKDLALRTAKAHMA